MKKLFLSLVLFAMGYIPAHAETFGPFGRCGDMIAQNAGSLIAPVQRIKSVTKVSDEIFVALVSGKYGDSVIPVEKQSSPDIHRAFSDERRGGRGSWIGVVETVDGRGQPALWMQIFVHVPGGCVTDSVGERVYDARANAPQVFWDAVSKWESKHPESRLVRTK